MLPPSDDQAHRSWPRIEALIDALLDTPPEQRTALIETLSAGDAERRKELERLRAACETEPEMLRRSAVERFSSLFDEESSAFPQSLSARYQPSGEVGRGGMATVFLARDLKHGRDVAVKVVHPSLTALLGSSRFLNEIAIVAPLRHPHIVPLYDSGESDGALYFVMPYEAGESLRQRLAHEGALPWADVVVILRDVCDALAYAHSKGVIHGDIKPDNILLSGRHALVVDFGVAKAAHDGSDDDESSTASLVFGTPAYMAPEQVAAKAGSDHRADLYSVGVLAYELLTGRPPFVGASRQALFAAHQAEEPPHVASIRPEVPDALAQWVMRCLEKKPDDRWQDASAMLERLETIGAASERRARPARGARAWIMAALGAVMLGVAAFAFFTSDRKPTSLTSWRDRWFEARISKLTDFAGSEVDAAISPDGRLVAFLGERDSVYDALVTQVGSGHFVNLTNGTMPQLLNEDVRNLGFTADAAHVWLRVADITAPARVALVPTMGGTARPFLGTAVTAAWSADGARLAYHETTPGDPIFVADRHGANARRIHIAEPGFHNHHVAWSPDGRYVYFTHGLPPDEMDVWRVPEGGGEPERMTHHDSRVAYPVLLDERTLLYTATAEDGTGPWLYLTDVEQRVSQRVGASVEHYLSIAASNAAAGEVRRLVATVSNPAVQLWQLPITGAEVDEALARRLALPTERSAAPRFAPDASLLYLASRDGADGVWRYASPAATEVWKPEAGALIDAPVVSPDGNTVCVAVREAGRSRLHCIDADGTDPRTLGDSLDVKGAPSWSPDGRWLAVAAREGRRVRLFKVPSAGGAPVPLVDSVASNPVWSPDGTLILYSGTPRGRSAPVKAVSPDGAPVTIPDLTVDRVGDSYRFLGNGQQVVVKLGGFRRQDFWLVDLANGRRRRISRLRPGEALTRFDVSPDGRQLVFERVRENSDVVLIEVPPR